MTALDFPASPTVGQIYNGTNGISYTWDGTVWTVPQGGTDLWSISGGALTPVDATKRVAIPGDANGNALLVGSPTFKGRLIQNPGGATAYLTENVALTAASPYYVQDDVTKSSWLLTVNAQGDVIQMQRIPAGSTTATNMLTIDASANLTINGATATKASGTTWSNPSDPRLKQDIAPYAAGLADVCRLAPITYRLKAQPDGPLCYGFDAEKVRDVFPECVSTTKMKLNPDDEEETEGVLTFDMHPILVAVINALKEVERRLAALEAR